MKVISNFCLLLWLLHVSMLEGFLGGSDGKTSASNAGGLCVCPRVGKISWRREWLPTPVLLPGKSHGQRSLLDFSPWGCKESDTTDRVTLSLTCGLLILPIIQKLKLSQLMFIASMSSHWNSLVWRCHVTWNPKFPNVDGILPVLINSAYKRTSLVVQWLRRIHFPRQGVQVQSLVGKLRSHMPWGQKTKP